MILANSLATPAIGTIFWTTLIFGLLLILLRIFAWKPILAAVKAREESIKSSLEAANEARKDMERLKTDNEAIMKEARVERDMLMKEARDARDKMIGEAKNRAKVEADKIVEKARTGIEKEKQSAITEIRDHVAELAVDIAGKILKESLKELPEQEKLINNLLDDIDLTRN
ncbi:MAG: F0F1 ATP synthase subunit B [Bacteroidales bacterium]|nr:F0F1 ATP synthase subunit B [Bacteroidales bacterium]